MYVMAHGQISFITRRGISDRPCCADNGLSVKMRQQPAYRKALARIEVCAFICG